EVQPIISSTQETVETVRGTAVFVSKHLVDPVLKANSALRGLGKVVGNVEAIRKAAGFAAAAAAAASVTGARSQPQAAATEDDPQTQEGSTGGASGPSEGDPTNSKSKNLDKGENK
ncbi:MAG: hypothetical protein GYB68_01975, partial [Chloroflexi bacterium]|nr:hypothetical protein [Chloroflexota bacterium]